MDDNLQIGVWSEDGHCWCRIGYGQALMVHMVSPGIHNSFIEHEYHLNSC